MNPLHCKRKREEYALPTFQWVSPLIADSTATHIPIHHVGSDAKVTSTSIPYQSTKLGTTTSQYTISRDVSTPNYGTITAVYPSLGWRISSDANGRLVCTEAATYVVNYHGTVNIDATSEFQATVYTYHNADPTMSRRFQHHSPNIGTSIDVSFCLTHHVVASVNDELWFFDNCETLEGTVYITTLK